MLKRKIKLEQLLDAIDAWRVIDNDVADRGWTRENECAWDDAKDKMTTLADSLRKTTVTKEGLVGTNMKHQANKSRERILAKRVVRMIKSECKLLGFLWDHPTAICEEFPESKVGCRYERLKMIHDEDFCLVREILREVLDDKNLLHC